MKINKKLFLFLLPLLFFIPKNTFALEIGGVALPGVTTTISSGQSSYTWYPPNFGAFSNWGPGYLRFDFSISTNIQTSATSPFAFSRGVIASVDNVPYICEVGSPSVNNSTYVATTYSAVCPMNMTSGGIGSIEFKFGTLGATLESSYTLSLTGVFSYEQAPQTQVNIDMNTVSNSIQQQITNDNTNTDKIVESNKKTQEEIKKQTEETKKTNDYLTDDSDATFDSSKLDTVTGLFPEGPVDSLLNIPFKFLSVITSSLSGSCVPFTCNFVYDTTLTLPCFDSLLWNSSNVDSNLLNYLSLLPSAFILIIYFKHLYKKVERATSMETTSEDEWGCV